MFSGSWTGGARGPPWTMDRGSAGAHQIVGLLALRGSDPCHNFTGRERRTKGSSPRAALGNGVTELGWHMEAWRRNEDNGSGWWRWQLRLGPFHRVREGEARQHQGGGWPVMVGIQFPAILRSKRGRGVDGRRASVGE
jgi:hypothetical protein